MKNKFFIASASKFLAIFILSGFLFVFPKDEIFAGYNLSQIKDQINVLPVQGIENFLPSEIKNVPLPQFLEENTDIPNPRPLVKNGTAPESSDSESLAKKIFNLISEILFRIQENAKHVASSVSDLISASPEEKTIDQSESLVSTPIADKPIASPTTPRETPPPFVANPATASIIQQVRVVIGQDLVDALQKQIDDLRATNNQNLIQLNSTIARMSQFDNIGPRGSNALTIASPTFTGTAQGLGDDDIPNDITISSASLSSTATSTFSGGLLVSGGNVGIGTSTPRSHQLSVAEEILVGGTSTSTFEGHVEVWGNLQIGQNSIVLSENSLETSGSFTITAASTEQNIVLQSLGRVGVSSGTPWAVLSVEHNGGDDDMPVFVVGDEGTTAPAIIVDGGYERVGFGTSSPYAQVAIEVLGESNNNANEGLAAFVISSRGTSTPFFFVNNSNGYVGIATDSPANVFAVAGDVVFGGSATSTIDNGLKIGGAVKVGSLDIVGECNGCGILYNNITEVGSALGISSGTPALTLEVGGFGVVKGDWNIQGTSTLSSLIATSTLEVRGIGGSSLPDFNVVEGVVGIASATPGTRFDVAGDGLFKGGLYVQATTTTSSLIATSTLEVRGSDGSNKPAFLVNDDRVGIATSAPGSLLSVPGLANFPSLYH